MTSIRLQNILMRGAMAGAIIAATAASALAQTAAAQPGGAADPAPCCSVGPDVRTVTLPPRPAARSTSGQAADPDQTRRNAMRALIFFDGDPSVLAGTESAAAPSEGRTGGCCINTIRMEILQAVAPAGPSESKPQPKAISAIDLARAEAFKAKVIARQEEHRPTVFRAPL